MKLIIATVLVLMGVSQSSFAGSGCLGLVAGQKIQVWDEVGGLYLYGKITGFAGGSDHAFVSYSAGTLASAVWEGRSLPNQLHLCTSIEERD